MNKHVAQKPRSKKAEQRAETMEQILDAAEDLFSKHGLHGVTLKEVAKRVGVHHTLLNYYFSDKKTLFGIVFYGTWGTPSARNRIIAIPTIAQGYTGRAK